MSDDRGSDGPMRVDTDLVRQLAEMLSENELTEIEVQDGERRIVVKREVTLAAPPPPPIAVAAPPPLVPAAAEAAPAPAPAGDDPASHPGTLRSPMVGTAYLSSEPGSPPFVTPGAQVAAGDTLLIIEAMKVMNPITAPKAGTLKQMLVQDAQPVEFDQPLAIID